MRALHFGAGNIGKGLIGYLLHKSGYEICFVDVDQNVVDSINKNNSYSVELLDDDHKVETIYPVSAINSTNSDQVIDAIVGADIITTSVGINNLPQIAVILSKGLLKRLKENRKKINIIANENAVNATSFLKKEIEKHVSEEDMNEICSFVGFPNAVIDRVALSRGQIALVEPFYEWIINKSEMVSQDLLIKDAIYVDDLQPYIERKLYIVNMAHASIAYIGYLMGETTIQSALENPKIERFAKNIFNEASQYLIKKFNFRAEDMSEFIEKIINRFKNKNIRDSVLRVARSPIRKLGYEERLVKPTRELFKLGLPIENLTLAIAAAFLFDYPEDEEAVKIQEYISKEGIERAILHFTKIEDEKIKEMIKENYCQLKYNREAFFSQI